MKKKYTKKENKLIETHLTNYFEYAEKRTSIKNDYPLDGDFEVSKVYDGILGDIKYKKRKVAISIVVKIAASVLLIFSLSLLMDYFNYSAGNRSSKDLLVEQSAPKGKIIKVTLTDGTIVVLNSGSQLIYPKAFNTKIRCVTLKGEGYFKVAHDPHKPFIVQTDKINTQVLGTSFNINSYQEREDIRITVLTGKVGVYLRNIKSQKNTQFITANQQVIFNKSKRMLVKTDHPIDTSELVAWIKGRMVYDNMPLIDVITDIDRHYDVDIAVSDQLQHCRITANFENDNLEKVLKVLTKLIDGKIQYKKGKYHLTGKGC